MTTQVSPLFLLFFPCYLRQHSPFFRHRLLFSYISSLTSHTENLLYFDFICYYFLTFSLSFIFNSLGYQGPAQHVCLIFCSIQVIYSCKIKFS